VGLSLALVALAQARIPAGTGQVPAYASLMAESSVKLGVTPVGRELLPKKTIDRDGSVSGLVEVSNLTSGSLVVEPRLRRLGPDTPDALRLQLTAGRRTLYDGTLGDFHARTRLRPRSAQRLRFRLSMPESGARDVQGRSAKLVVTFATTKAGR
jgi:hypothetical protein